MRKGRKVLGNVQTKEKKYKRLKKYKTPNRVTRS